MERLVRARRILLLLLALFEQQVVIYFQSFPYMRSASICVESPAILLIFLDFFAYVFVVIDLHTFPFFQLGSPPVDRASVTHHFQLYI